MSVTHEARTLLATGARTATVTGPDVTNLGHRGLHLVVDVTVLAAAETITPKVQGRDANGIYYDVWTAAAAIAATGTKTYQLYPGATDAAAMTEAKAVLLPPVWRVVLTHSSTGSHTYSVGAQLIA